MKKLLSVSLSLVLVFGVSTSVFAAEKKPVACKPTGDGTQKSPITICTPDQLHTAVKDSSTKHYKLGADIDLNGYTSKWSPTTEFAGVFSGKGYKILNLTTSSVGLFNIIKAGAKVTNVTLVNGKSSGYLKAAGLAITNNGTIENSLFSGSVTGARFSSGGLVDTNNGKISDSFTEGTVNNVYVAGGLVATQGKDGSISNSYSKSVVTSSYGGGGLVSSNSGTIQNSYSSGKVISDLNNGGGFIGKNYATGVIKKSYATGNVYAKLSLSSGTYPASNFVQLNQGKIENSYGTGKVLDYSLRNQ